MKHFRYRIRGTATALMVGVVIGSSVYATEGSDSVAEPLLKEGARDYWAYQVPRKTAVPQASAHKDWVKSPVDAFVLKGLAALSLAPNPEAEAGALLRRAFYDLTGLAPGGDALAAIDAAGISDAQWAQIIDQLLASPRFGEKLASLWLDVVRYAETNGFERDSRKPFMWRYRDYVIRAFNDNTPYDQFLREQLAGDQLPDPTFDQVIATGFLTLMQRDDEPADKLQGHHDMISDVVDVAGEAFMGTTMGCAKCHDHKGDPIRQADYYAMKAFFDGLAQSNLKEATGHWVSTQDRAAHETERREVDQAVQALWRGVGPDILLPYTQKSDAPRALIAFGDTSKHAWQVSDRVPASVDWTLPSYRGEDFTVLPTPLKPTRDSLLNVSPKLDKARQWVLRTDLGLTELPESLIMYLRTDRVKALKIYFNGDKVYEGRPAKAGPYFYVPFSAHDVASLTTGRNTLGIVLTREGNATRDVDVGFYLDPVVAMGRDAFVQSNPEKAGAILGESFVSTFKTLAARRATLSKKQESEPYMGAREVGSVGIARVHKRGNANVPGAEVAPAFPAVMCRSDQDTQPSAWGGSLNPPVKERRLVFAQWVTQPDHPLTARVMVNRLWQLCFGVGLVPGANDFGVFGEAATDTELLDWLAVEFVDSGWDIKHMLRLMMTSATYRQSVAPRQDALRADPLNRKHWRHNPRRLTAEEIRDGFLRITGELNLEGGGAPVRPRMPQAVLATSSKPGSVWPETKGPAANRRSVYVHVKRSIQLPMLSAFDAPQRDATCARRFATTVPTQALTMLNSAFVNDCAAKLAVRVSEEATTMTARIQRAFALACGRQPSPAEAKELAALDHDLKETYAVADEQRLAQICLVVLNLNETLYLD